MPAFDRTEAQRLLPFFKTIFGRLVMEAAFCILGLDRFNRIYDRCAERASGPDFARELLALNGNFIAVNPSGAVSDLSLRDGRIRDREWQEAAIRLIQKARVPVLPLHYACRNTRFYYLLGLLSWKLRLTRLPRENKIADLSGPAIHYRGGSPT